ncbi:tail assembly chaperone [Gordonia phage Schmidt]|uniref:Tail assembly chaperone n=1 Tax=Gordonia phage Schmidt TaxID=2301697 RepID=A0A385E2K3_9CAUD|nr:tail assembly chaperone [Gordonia phage Schmidt]AXQ65138.1 tail assembly chaperone [Gordonia phage Schmidt]
MSTYDLGAIVEQRAEAVGGETIEFQWKGETFTIPHPLLADDDFKDGLLEVETDMELAEYYLGEEQFDRFRELGGRSGYIGIMLAQIQRDAMAEDEDGNPTQSRRSSGRGPKRQKRR